MRFLKAVWAGWMAFAHRIGTFNTKLLLFAFYYVSLGPISYLSRVFQPDPLGKRIDAGSLYVAGVRRPESLERAKRQF
jgi:saxitoxin biosynthesis operon SxtJ-like protein